MGRSFEIESLLERRYLRHILFWLAYVLTMTYIHGLGIEGGRYFPWFMNYMLELPIITGLSYTIVYWIIPKFVSSYKIWTYILLVLMLFTVFSFVNVLVDQYIISPLFFNRPDNEILFAYILRNAFGLVFPVGIFTSLSMIKYNYKEKNFSEKKSLQTELTHTRNRMHPVFLRDTLDNMYWISNIKPEILPEAILKVSEILNYFLFECDEEKVPLRKEEQAIRLYMGFQTMVYKGRSEYDLHIQADIKNFSIAPYILFPLVRAVYLFNSDPEENPGKIHVLINIINDELIFSASQKINKSIIPTSYGYEWNDEINLSRNRLELMYSWRYKLDVRETERKLLINLSLQLN